MIRKAFWQAAALFGARPRDPETYIGACELRESLNIFILTGAADNVSVNDPRTGNAASYTVMNRVDGKTFEFHATILRDGAEYKTDIVATLARNGVYEVQSIVFDNRPDPLKTRDEIRRILKYVGSHYVRAIDCRNVPKPHKIDRGEFGFIPRTISRLLS